MKGTIIEAGFKYGTTSGSLSSTAKLSSPSAGDKSLVLKGLKENTTYYYKAYAVVQGTEDYASQIKTFYGSEMSFKTKEDLRPKGLLELPKTETASNLINGCFGSGKSRNYSYCYDTDRYAARWEAYPLTANHTQGTASTSSWRYNPNIDNKIQVDVVSAGYGTNYGNDTYSRGHLVPNADRKCDDTMNLQTYYVTNQVPMIQNKFNAGIWSSIEGAIRAELQSFSDTLYVVVGPSYKTVGGSETISYLQYQKQLEHATTVPIPNYCWKAVLKVRRSGNEIVGACAVAFWLAHRTYEDASSYANYTISIDQLEARTGIDFFANLPDSVEAAAEQNSSWETFKAFGNSAATTSKYYYRPRK